MNDKIKLEMEKSVINNLLTFLDRVEIKGLQEISAMNQILSTIYKSDSSIKDGDN